MMDFSSHAGAGSDFDLLPKGLLAWAILSVRGLKGSGSGGQYLDVELTIAEGQPYAGRKLWETIGDPNFTGNSEKYRNMGMVAITRILEAGRGAGPNNPAGYQIVDYSQLSGLRVAIKVGIEEGSEGHDDKNRVAEWLTPNPASQSGNKGFVKLSNGDHGIGQPTHAPPASGFGGAPAIPAANGGFGNGGSGAPAPQSQTSGFGNTGSGFQAPPQGSSGQAEAGATTAGSQSQQTGATAPPSDPGTTPGWLQQAGAQG